MNAYPPAPVQEGQVLAGKFRVERVLGIGGMGVVVSAMHLQLEQRVALKFVLPGGLTSPEAVERFAREARAAVRLRSEHVARVLDVGTLETGSPYIVMEFLEGRDLATVLSESGPLSAHDAIDFVVQACEAIAEAHSLGIIHRDLKPRNLFLTRRVDGRPLVKVLDFGISKVTSPTGTEVMSLTRTTEVMGSPNYMSPEQLRSSRNVDTRTDIWSLGVILYELLTGRVPFEAETVTQLCAMVLQDTPRAIHELRPDLPPELTHAIFRCLEKDPARRYPTVAALAHALEPFAALPSGAGARLHSVAARISGAQPLGDSSSQPRVAVTGGTSPSWGAPAPPLPAGGRSARIVALAALATITIAGGGAAYLFARRASLANGAPLATASASAASSTASTPPPPPPASSPPPAPSASASASTSASATAAPPTSITPPKPSAPLSTSRPRPPPPKPPPSSKPTPSPDEMPNERH